MYQQTPHFHVLFDGGSRGNGSAEQEAYGSYCIADSHKSRIYRHVFGNATNNQAEYYALITALDHLVDAIVGAGKSPSDFIVRVVGDSMLVLNQVAGEWKCKAATLKPLHAQAQGLAARFNAVLFEHTPRDTCARVLGH